MRNAVKSQSLKSQSFPPLWIKSPTRLTRKQGLRKYLSLEEEAGR